MWAIYTKLEVIQFGQHIVKWRLYWPYRNLAEAMADRRLCFFGDNWQLGFASAEELEVWDHFNRSAKHG